MCSNRAATTGETVTVGSLLSFGLAIRGWFANKDSKASKENVRVTATLLNDLRPTVVFSMSNENDGVTLLLVTVMSDGCALGHIKQAAARALCNAKSHPPLDQLASVQIKAGRKRPRAQLRTDR
jgi:hypothetical protein